MRLDDIARHNIRSVATCHRRAVESEADGNWALAQQWIDAALDHQTSLTVRGYRACHVELAHSIARVWVRS